MKLNDIILFIAIFLFLLLFYRTKEKECFEQENIPKYFFQIWINNDNNIPQPIVNNFNTIKNDNPEFECQLFNKEDCIHFLKNHYDEDVINAYHKLIPGAYKADLMRYCILYKNGGIYLDAKMMPTNGFKLNHVIDKEYFVRDSDFDGKGRGVWNGFMVCKKNNPLLLELIVNIVENVKNKYYGETFLSPTGPFLLKKKFTEEQINDFDYEYIYINNTHVVTKYPDNYDLSIIKIDYDLSHVQSLNSSEKNYRDLWNEKNIYVSESFTSN
jgi:mannosyltransferase OCH1-like enzyme